MLFLALFKSITFDNETEFRDFKGMSKSIFDKNQEQKYIMPIYIIHGNVVPTKMEIE